MLPFRTGMKVTGREFCGRRNEVAQLRQYMQSAGRVYVVGERRIGKTSLIFEAGRRLTGRRLVYADLMAIKSVSDLSQRLAQAVVQAERQESGVMTLLRSLAALRPTISVDPATNLPTVGFEAGSGDRPETLDGIFALLGSWEAPVIVLDEFQDILSLPAEEAVVARLRGLVQQQEGPAFVFCGSQRRAMETIFTDRGSPFFHAAMRLHVGPIERRSFRRFLERKFLAAERRLEAGLLDVILDACHDNPGDTQRFCTALWQVTGAGQVVSRDDLAAAWSAIYAMQSDQYELVMQSLSRQQADVLRALSRSGGESNLSRDFVASTGIPLLPSVAKAMQGLVSKRIVAKVGTRYRVADPFLGAWLAREGRAPYTQ